MAEVKSILLLKNSLKILRFAEGLQIFIPSQKGKVNSPKKEDVAAQHMAQNGCGFAPIGV